MFVADFNVPKADEMELATKTKQDIQSAPPQDRKP